MEELVARAKRVRLVAFDVDGVCTDGRLYYGPEGEAMHAFHARDGLGIVRARLSGLVLAAVTGRVSKNVDARLRELKVPHILQGVLHKDDALGEILTKTHVTWNEVAWIGDDVNDIPCMRKAGLAACVPDAADDVPAHVHLVTEHKGGRGALRELLELVMKAQGTWRVDGVP
jgi:3-deoxy-D-manno-octulosonate 8-phosphate phosphatase (KDO 8-P phosphatase)